MRISYHARYRLVSKSSFKEVDEWQPPGDRIQYNPHGSPVPRSWAIQHVGRGGRGDTGHTRGPQGRSRSRTSHRYTGPPGPRRARAPQRGAEQRPAARPPHVDAPSKAPCAAHSRAPFRNVVQYSTGTRERGGGEHSDYRFWVWLRWTVRRVDGKGTLLRATLVVVRIHRTFHWHELATFLHARSSVGIL